MLKLIHGKDSYLSLKAAKTQFKQLCSDHPEYESLNIDCEQLPAEQIVALYQTDGMFSSGKNIILRRLSNSSDKDEILQDLMDSSTKLPENINIIIWENQKIAANTRYFKFFKNMNAVEESPELNKRSFTSWAEESSAAEGVKLSRNVIQQLSHSCNFSAEAFMNLIMKIKASGKSSLTEAEIDEISSDNFENTIWQLIDSINNREEGVLPSQILDNLFAHRVDPIYILTMITRNTRTLILVQDLADKGLRTAEIASILRVPPFTLPSLIASAKASTREKLNSLYKRLYNLDFEIKTGNIEPELGLTLLCTII